MARVAINGFGRIGRQSFKALLERYADDLEIVAVNDLTDNETLAHLLRHDSTYGPFEGEVRVTEDQITVDFYSEDDDEEHRVEMAALAEKDPTKLPWRDMGIDIVIESTGRFTDAEKARAHLQAGAKKVIITAPAKGEDITICLGVNETKYDHADPQHHLERLLHHQLPRAGGQGAQRSLRHPPRPDDDDPLLHDGSEPSGQCPQGSAPRARRRDQHRADDHRRGQGAWRWSSPS